MERSGSGEQPVCWRPRCNRKKALDSNGLCIKHRCTVPDCRESKSSKVSMCDFHIEENKLEVPRGWQRVEVDGATFFLNLSWRVAQRDHPGVEGRRARKKSTPAPSIKPGDGYPILFTVEPQPEGLLSGWEQVVVTYDDGSLGLRFRNLEDLVLQQANPSPETKSSQAAGLPIGWTTAHDSDGDIYFVNHNMNITTYEDPRIFPNPRQSAALPRLRLKAATLTKAREQTSVAKSKSGWHIGPCDKVAYTFLDDNLTEPEELPEYARGKYLNRYIDILPNPATRVKLPARVGAPATEYYNANFVRSFDGDPRFYIAAMGPEKHTAEQFWRLIWHTRVETIVMATGLIEKGQPKCAHYWPNVGTSMVFGTITVKAIGTEVRKGTMRTKLEVTRDGKSRTVHHHWYYTWPDHGVPTTVDHAFDCDDVIGLLLNVREEAKKGRPLLVHCSAGIGRTGCFIAVDHAMKELEATGKTNILDIVKNIRQDRCALVQHTEQFEFAHACCVRFAEMRGRPISIETSDAEKREMQEESEYASLSERELQMRRNTEKDKAAERAKAASLRKSKAGTLTTLTQSQLAGELFLGTIAYDSEEYIFLDPDDTGRMSREDARLQGMPMELFDLIEKRDKDVITVLEWKNFVRTQARRR